jgi:N-dimethylarginine dimethylaminohydrolase
VARRLADMGVPILRTLTGNAVFEGADLMWVDPETVMIGLGLRTNEDAASQIAAVLEEVGIETLAVDIPYGTMHFMGMLRIVDEDLAICWPRRALTIATAAWASDRRSTRPSRSRICPISMRDRSSTSSIRLSRCWPLIWMSWA